MLVILIALGSLIKGQKTSQDLNKKEENKNKNRKTLMIGQSRQTQFPMEAESQRWKAEVLGT